MNRARLRAYCPELLGITVALACLGGISAASGFIAATLQMHANRKLITAAGMTVIAVSAAIALLVIVLVAHARQAQSVVAFFVHPVPEKRSPWRRGLLYCAVYAGCIGFALLIVGILY